MSNKMTPSNKRKATAGLVFCFVAAIALVGTYTVRNYQSQVEKKLAQAEEEAQAAIDEFEDPSKKANNLVVKEEEPDSKAKEDELEQKQTEDDAAGTEPTANQPTSANFSPKDGLLWPVSGNVLLNYSMDKTIYFATLDQYKYNPALVIAGAVNDQVISAGSGIVKSIDITAQTGNTVTLDMGNGYEAIYGQLKEVPVKVGDFVESKGIIGYLSEPTKYYSVEGCNLYFEVRKDGQPINPMEFLQ